MIIPSSLLTSSSLSQPPHHAALLDFAASRGITALSMAAPFLGDTTATASLAAALVSSIAHGGGTRVVELFAKHHATALDLNRVRMRLDGLQLYATLTALLTNGCLRLYSSVSTPTPAQEEQSSWQDKLSLDLFFICATVSILSGSYTTIVFGLLSLYSKTALGRGLDNSFLSFWAATSSIRESALESFLFCLISFELAFILSLFIRLSGRRRKLLVALACIMSFLSFRKWTQIMILASKFLFTLRAETQF